MKLSLSKVGLGTVEIGLPYGTGEKRLPSDQEAEAILKTALEAGITYFDTARGYGVAEERLGKFGISTREGVVIGTKCGQFLKTEQVHGAELEKRLREEIDTSRTMLNQETLQLVQFHNELADFTDYHEFIEIMQQLVAEGKILHVGVSTRGEEAPLAAYATGFFATSQLAYSILDQRMAPRVLPAAAEQHVHVINRSVLLRGALTPAGQTLPNELAPLKDNAQAARVIAGEVGVDLPTLALRFSLSNPLIGTVLIGAHQPEHVTVAMAAAAAGALPEKVMEKLHGLGLTDPLQVDPAKWPAGA